MDENVFDPKASGNPACMLGTGTAKACQNMLPDVKSAHD